MEKVDICLLGKGSKVQKALEQAKAVSSTNESALIVGEAGVGKSLLAEFIHQESDRGLKTLEIVNCSEDQTLVANNVLGYTDKQTGRYHRGVLETANRGTVVLADVDNMTEAFQKKTI